MRYFIIPLLVFLVSSCAGVRQTEQPSEPVSLLYIDGVVQGVSNNEVTLALKLPEFKQTPDMPIREIAEQVVRKSLFLEGISTDINGIPAVIKEVRGAAVIVALEKPFPLAPGAAIKLKIPKKTIAVVDFEVIRGKQKEAGRVTLEGLTSALIDSGHFTVVERAKLKTVIDELQLSMSGLTRETPDKVIGKLLTADLILTGTLAEVGGIWDINLRLLNVRTGQAVAAISMRTHMFKPTELRDASPLNEDFEGDTVNGAWSIGYKAQGAYSVKLDTTQGAENSQHALRMDLNFQNAKNSLLAKMENMKKRDLSLYSGVEFYVKADTPLTGEFRVLISEENSPNTIDAFAAFFDVGTEWKQIKIPFDQLVIGRSWVKDGAQGYGAKTGKQILDLGRVETIAVGAHAGANPPVKGIMWLDKILFYRD